MIMYSLPSIFTSEPGIPGEQNDIADLHRHGHAFAVIGQPTAAYRHYAPLLRLLFSRVRKNDAAACRLFGFNGFD